MYKNTFVPDHPSSSNFEQSAGGANLNIDASHLPNFRFLQVYDDPFPTPSQVRPGTALQIMKGAGIKDHLWEIGLDPTMFGFEFHI